MGNGNEKIMENPSKSKLNKRTKYGFLLTVFIGLIICILPTPEGLTPEGQRALALLVMAAILWLGDVIDLGATSILIIAAGPLLGTIKAKTSMAYLGHDIIFLFLGGFIIAISMTKYGLDKRIALWLVKKVGVSAKKVLLGLMIAVGFLSMWMSNTVAVLCLLPIVLGILKILDIKPGEEMGKMFLFGLAFASLCGGISTIIGTPPNALVVSFLKESSGIEITFGQWFIIGSPIGWITLLVTWWVMVNIVYKVKETENSKLKDYIYGEYDKMGSVTAPEKITAFTLIVFVGLLLTLPQLAPLFGGSDYYNRGVVAIVPTAILYFTGLMNWKDTKNGVAWHILLLFAAGLTLSGVMKGTGAALWIATLIGETVPVSWIPVTFTLLGCIMTQMTSNSGATAIFAPIAISTATMLGVDPLLASVPLAIGCSLGFLTPVGSALNPVIYGQLTDGNTYINKAKDYWVAGRLPWLIGTIIVIVYVIFILPMVMG